MSYKTRVKIWEGKNALKEDIVEHTEHTVNSKLHSKTLSEELCLRERYGISGMKPSNKNPNSKK